MTLWLVVVLLSPLARPRDPLRLVEAGAVERWACDPRAAELVPFLALLLLALLSWPLLSDFLARRCVLLAPWVDFLVAMIELPQ
jgi:hypothetical protein